MSRSTVFLKHRTNSDSAAMQKRGLYESTILKSHNPSNVFYRAVCEVISRHVPMTVL